MNFSEVKLIAWAIGSIGLVILLVVILVRRRYQTFPIFTLYVVQQILASAILYLIWQHFSQKAYRHFYWSSCFFDETLQLLLVYEIAVHVFRPTGVWARDVRRTLIEIAAISILLAWLMAWIAHPATIYPFYTFVLRSTFFSSALMSELFVGMLVLSSTVGLTWKTHVARIAQGFGAFSLYCVGMDIAAIYFGLGRNSYIYAHLTQVRGFVYLACEYYWIVMLWAKAPAPSELPESMKIQIYTLQRQVENDLVRVRSWSKN